MNPTYYELTKTNPSLTERTTLGTIILVGTKPHHSIEQELRRTGLLAPRAGFTIGLYKNVGFLMLGENNSMFILQPGGDDSNFIRTNAFKDNPLITKMRNRPLRTVFLRCFNALFPTNYPTATQ